MESPLTSVKYPSVDSEHLTDNLKCRSIRDANVRVSGSVGSDRWSSTVDVW